MAARTFEDSSGLTWEVFEVHRASNKEGAVNAGLEKGWLAFANGTSKRRLAPFPPDWTSATPLELERLCAAARVAQPRIVGRPPEERRRGAKPGTASVGETPAFVQTEPASRTRGAGDGLVVPESRLQPLEADGGDDSVEKTVRAFAHQARTLGLPAIEAMVRLKVLLLTNHPGPDSDARDMRRVRRWFVEAYYFERNA
jgi:hypothetical protein